MTFSAIKHISYGATGGYTAGAIAGYVMQSTISPKVAVAAYPHLGLSGIALSVTAAVARAADEVFKALGWQESPGTRLFAAQLVAGAIVYKPIMLFVGYPAIAGRMVALAVVVSSYAVNLITN
ncbi:MAG: hypothetical protein JSR37_06820 [Verrucomicrobia bacterium]|nr:hypothetical protein [Verrucomicrobiota bacterium]MBS0637929.1 hypothetical protein [Verrucomicrobiota bacterium]